MKRLLVILLFSSAQAATWTEYALSPDTTFEFEPTLVTKHDNSGKVLVVWTRSTNPRTTTTRKYELHCGSRSYRIIVEGRRSLGNEYYREDKNDRWKYAFPDSIEMALIDRTCPIYQ